MKSKFAILLWLTVNIIFLFISHTCSKAKRNQILGCQRGGKEELLHQISKKTGYYYRDKGL